MTAVRPRAWAWLGLLTALNILSWVDRQIIPALAPLLIRDLGLTSAQIGLLYGYAFILCFILAGLLAGWLADRISRARLIAAGLAAWSVFTAASGLAQSFGHLAAARVCVGIGEASLTPASLALLSDVFPERWRARAAGIFSIGLPVGSGFSLVVAGLLAPRYGWRACFFVLGVVGIAASLLVVMLRDPRSGLVTLGPPEGGPHRNRAIRREDVAVGAGFPPPPRLRRDLAEARPWRAKAGSRPWGNRPGGNLPAFIWLTAGATLVTFSTAATIHVLTWLVQERGFEFRHAAVLTGGIFAAAGTLGNVLGGWLADACEARWPSGRIWSLVLTQVALVPAALVFFTATPGSVPFYTGWVLSSLRSTIWYGPVYASAQDLSPVTARATAIAILMLAINLLGAGPGPWLAGAIGDRRSLTEGLTITTWIGLAAIVPFALAARYAGSKPTASIGGN